MVVAAIDLGTNTFLLLIAEVENEKIVRVLHDEARVVRLGQGVHQKRRFHPEALARAEVCFKDFQATIRQHPVARTIACATSAARDVSNAHEFIALGAKYEIPIRVISGEREAELTYFGTIPDAIRSPVVLIDVGGGSTEFILGDANGIRQKHSLDVGSVRLTEMFISSHPISATELARVHHYIDQELHKIPDAFRAAAKQAKVLAVSGTPTTLAAVDMGLVFDSQKVDRYRLSLERIAYWVQSMAAQTIEERRQLAGMDAQRADVLVSGALILQLASQFFNAKEMEVSIRGLRYGVARVAQTGVFI